MRVIIAYAARSTRMRRFWVDCRQLLPWDSGLPVIRLLPREHPATTRPLPNVYNISGFHSSTEVDESDVERHLGNDRPKPSNLRNLCGAAIPAAQFHPPSRRRVPDPRDAEDILQDAFYKLVEANRLLMPIDHVTSWLFRVARNRITDLFRKKKPETFSHASVADEDGELLQTEDLLPSPDAGPEALYVRNALLDQLELALDELPEEQREVFVAHELDGRSFKELAAETGVSVNTLLSRKRYAVLHLRERLQSIYDEFTKS